jgi:hypothetical protein
MPCFNWLRRSFSGSHSYFIDHALYLGRRTASVVMPEPGY